MMYWHNYININAIPFGTILPFALVLIPVLVVWSLFWKGKALWKAAHSEDKIWFIVLLVVNTLGILEILYIYVFSKKKNQQ